MALLRLVLIWLISLVMAFVSTPVYKSTSLLYAIHSAVNSRNLRVERLAREEHYPEDQYGVMAKAISAFAPTFTLTSTVNGYRVLKDTATSITVWIDESITIHWKVDSAFGNVDLAVFEKTPYGYKLKSLQWWADLREYLYEYKNLPQRWEAFLDLPQWNKQWVPYLMQTPSPVLTSTAMNPEKCMPPEVYTPSVAVSWMLHHIYPVGSFKLPIKYSTHFKYFPGDDCANSVSQSLYCGGMKTDEEWKPYSPAWIYVPKMWEYLMHHGWHKVSCRDAKPGDILLFDVNLSGTPEHATLITGRVDGRPLYTAHTSHKVNMPVPLGDRGMWLCYRYGR